MFSLKLMTTKNESSNHKNEVIPENQVKNSLKRMTTKNDEKESNNNNKKDEEPETTWEKTVRKFTKEPLVPIGCLVTALVLGNGLRAFKAGNTNTSQQMMRWRVIAQGATVIAIISGALPNIMEGYENKKSIEEKILEAQALQNQEK